MRNNKLTKILTNLIIVLLVCSAAVYAALHIRIEDGTFSLAAAPPAEEQIPDPPESNESEDTIPEVTFTPPEPDPDYSAAELRLGNFLYKDIYINGYQTNNWQLKYPFLKLDDTIYAPASENVLNAFGLGLRFDDASHWVCFSPTVYPFKKSIKEKNNACNLKGLQLYCGHSYWFDEQEVPAGCALTAKESKEGEARMLYLSLDALQQYSGLSFSWYYDDISGLYISTEADRPAESYLCENNRKYIEGRARFMMSQNSKLSHGDALYYEYLFRHEASLNKYVTEDTLIAVCRVESNFKPTVGTKALGMMQIIPKYAKKSGYSEKMLLDPHYNIEYGCAELAKKYKDCGGNEKMALAAYNAGMGNVQKQIKETGSYKTAYSDKCIKYRNMLESYIEKKNYSSDFLRYIVP